MLAQIGSISRYSNLAGAFFNKTPTTVAPVEQLPASHPPIIDIALPVDFSGSQFLVALGSGLIIAFAFQFLLTNLSVALAATPGVGTGDGDDEDSLGDTISGIETKVGLFILSTVTIALAIATFLAVKLSLVSNPTQGAIVGVTIWGAYFSLIVWLGSGAVGSLVGSLISTATSGLQGIMGAATSAIGANVAKNQVVSTAEDITAAVRRELTDGFDPGSIQKTLQSSLGKLELPKLDVDRIGDRLEQILKDADLKDLANNDLLKNVNRQTFVDLISSRTDFSKQDVNKIADRLESVWQGLSKSGSPEDAQGQLTQILKSIDPKDLGSEQVTGKIGSLVKQVSTQGAGEDSLTNQALRLGFTALMGKVLQRTDLSDLHIEKLVGQLQNLKSDLPGTTKKVIEQVTGGEAKPQFNVIKADLENYLVTSPPWKLNRVTIEKEFKDVIYDPQAAPSKVRQQLESIDRNYFLDLLSQRSDLRAGRAEEIATQLDTILAEVYETVKTAAADSSNQDLRSKVENYLKSTGKAELNPDAIEREFKLLLEDPSAGVEALGDRLGQFDRDTLTKLLEQRQDIDAEGVNGILDRLESTRDRVLSEARDLQERTKNQAQELRHKVEEYLRNTNKDELNPEGIQRDFQTLLEDPQAGVNVLKDRFSQFDRETLVSLLSQRQDLSEEQINQTIDQIESVRDRVLNAPQEIADKAKHQYEQTTAKIAEYLRKTNLEELDPEGIQADLAKLFEDPKAGASALQERLGQVDRETLVKLLSQGDLSEEQVNNAIDKVQTAISNIVKAPRRLASRVQKQAVKFEQNIEEYLRNTDKAELDPDSIKRDLQLLLEHPQAGLSSLGDRVGEFDRDTFVSLLSQRDDLSEEEANQIVDRIESTYKSIVERFQQAQQALQSALDGVLGNVRDYLNSLDVPELNYEGIQQDFSTLFDDPQAGFEALRSRLGEFDRDTLVAVISSRDDISTADANKIVDRIEATRDRVLHQAERIQTETQKRLQAVKDQAKKRAIATQKLAAGAAWWLFSTGVTSLAVSAAIGFIAVGKDIF
jgi:ElaB/YqjD/DUF883 family membrane-anchored ribosome-binding protein